MDISFKSVKVSLVAAITLAVFGFGVRSVVTEGEVFIIALAFAGIFLFFCLWSKKVFVFFACCALASVNLNLVGVDPGDVLIPCLLFIGIILGHLNIHSLRFPPLLRLFFAAFVFFYVVSMAINEFIPIFVAHLISNVAFLCFLKLYVDSAGRMRQVLLSLLVGAGLTSILAVAAIFGLWVPGEMFFEPVGGLRYASLIGDPNILSIITVLLALWILDELLDPKLLRTSWWITGVLLVLALVQIGLTQSRSGWLNLLVCLCCYVSWDVYKGRIKKALLVGSVTIAILSTSVGLIFLLESGDTLLDRVDSVVFHVSQEEEERFNFVYTKNAIGLVFDHTFGVGAGLTGERLDQISVNGGFIGAHNSYVQILSDNGWGAFLAFVAILASIGFSLVVKRKGEEAKFGLSYQFLTCGLLGLAVNGMFHDLIEWQVAWILPALATTVLWPRRRLVTYPGTEVVLVKDRWWPNVGTSDARGSASRL